MLLISISQCLRALPLAAALTFTQAQPLQAQIASAQFADRNTAAADLPRTESTGSALIARGRYVAAIELLRGLEPKSASIYNKMGVACEHMYMAVEARQDFEQAVRLNPRYSEALNNLGTVFHTSGDLRHAEQFYKKAIRADPANVIAEVNLGTLLYAKGKYRKGDLAYRRALAIDPHALEKGALNSVGAPTDSKGLAELRYHIAKTYAGAGNNELALDLLHKAISAGFKDKKRLLDDPEFAGLRKMPEFGSLLAELAGG